MERDRELEHYEWLGGCNEDGFEDGDMDAGERGFSDKPVPTTNPNGIGASVLVAETEAQRVADEAARRVARNTTEGVKRVAAAFGVEI